MDIKNEKLKEDYLLESVKNEEFTISNSLFQGNLEFRDCHFSKFSLKKIKVKGSISFKGCSFDNDISINGVQSKESINFHNCNFKKSLSLFDIKVTGDLNWLNTKIEEDLNIDTIIVDEFIAQKLEVRNVQFYHSTPCSIKKILVKNSSIIKKISVVNIKQLKSIEFENLTVGAFLEIDRIDLSNPVEIKLLNIFSNYLKVHNFNGNKNLALDIQECTFDKIQITNLNLIKGYIDFKNTYNSGSTKIASINTFQSYINIGDLVFGELIMDKELTEFINDKTLSSPLFDKSLNHFNQKIKTLNNLKKMFNSNGDFQAFDSTHYLLKNIEYKSRIYTKSNFLQKSFPSIKFLVGKYIFGWGVRLQSILLSLLAVILFYALGFLGLMIFNENHTFSLNGEIYSSLLSPLQLSVFYFIGFFGDINAPSINNSIGLGEHVIGILYFTLITGVILRKLFR